MSGGWLSDHKEMLLAGALVIVVLMAAFAIVYPRDGGEGFRTGTITVSQTDATEATITFGDFDPDVQMIDIDIYIENGTMRTLYAFDSQRGNFYSILYNNTLDEANTGDFLIASNTSWNHTVQPGDFCTFRISPGYQYEILIVIQGTEVASARLDT